ncbi:MAG: FAD-dependent oxidoreductase, partial [Bdellovibrionaceae bacterium]|nr:FAD-dependent oxidoreductase [Pseudobdellovibrionaceae bacterium]
HPIAEYKKKRFIFREGLKRWPLTISETLAMIFRFLPKLLFAKAQLKPRTDESIGVWGRKNLGGPAVRYLLAPALQGIYAGNIERMSADSIFGKMFSNSKKTKYKGTVAPENGMGELIQALRLKIESQGTRIHLNSDYVVTDLEIPHFVCVSAKASAKVVAPVAKELALQLSKIETLSLVSVTLFLETPSRPIQGFGCLVPEGNNVESLGILSNTYIFNNRGPGYSETWILGGARSPNLIAKSDHELIQQIQQDRQKLFGEAGKIVGFKIFRWPNALPHFTLEHNTLIRQLNPPKNLYLNGNYLDVIGLSKILARTEDMVAQVKEQT